MADERQGMKRKRSSDLEQEAEVVNCKLSEAAAIRLWHEMPPYVREYVLAAGRQAALNPCVADLATSGELNNAFVNSQPFWDQEHTGTRLLTEPFRACVVPDLLAGHVKSRSELLSRVKDELVQEHWNLKNNDLYYFRQTNDLKACTRLAITALCKLLYTDVLQWVARVTGFELDETKMDVFAARYPDTGTLLCHDDKLEGRRVAFILYMTEDWEEHFGGSLELFDTDENGQPGKVVHSIVPQWNTFAFFEVSAKSYHRVGEVIGAGRERWSITGWFHGPPAPPAPIAAQKSAPPVSKLTLTPPSNRTFDLKEWINPVYLTEQKSINKTFVDLSSMRLDGFLIDSKYEVVSAAVRDLAAAAVVHTGCPVHKSLSIVDPTSSAEIKDLHDFFASAQFLEYLNSLTSLELVGGRVGVQQFKHGDYTLMHDDDPTAAIEAVDVQLCIIPDAEEWALELGGTTTYVSESEELLAVVPKGNALSLVFKDQDTMRFIKFINHRAGGRSFVQAGGVYTEKEAILS